MAMKPIEILIEAKPTGDEKVEALAKTLEDLGKTLDEDVRAGADQAAAALRDLSAKNQAVQSFAALKRESADLGQALGAATANIERIANEMPRAAAATKQFSAAENAASAAVEAAQKDLKAMQLALDGLRSGNEGAARGTDEYKASVSQAREAIAALRATLQQKKTELQDATAATRTAASEENQLQEAYKQAVLSAKNASSAVGEKSRALDASRTALKAAGIETASLADAERNLKGAVAAATQEAQKMVPALEGIAKQSAESKAAIASAAKVMDESFRVLGVNSVRSLQGELGKLQTALAQIRANADILPADKRAAVEAFNVQVAKLKLEAKGAGDSMKTLEANADSTGNALAQAGQKALAWGAALGGLTAIKSVATDVIETGAQFETLRVRLENLLGGTQQATQAFDMIKQLAASTPFEVTALTESFVKLTAMGMKPTEAQMRSLSDVAANLGGGTEVLSGVTTALGQAWAKSKLQGEEINQLAERGVPVWDALTQATGRTVPELQRMAEAGLLGRDVITKLIDALGKQNLGASAKLMATYSGTVSNAKDAMVEFYDLISQAGVLDFLTRQIQGLLVEFERMKNTGELEQKAKALADGFLTIASAVEQAAKVIAYLGPELLKLGEVMVAMKIASWTQSLYSVGVAAVSSAAGVATLGTQAAATAVKMDVAAAAGTRVAGVLRLLRSLTGIGLVIGAAELAAEFLRAKNAAEAGDKAVEKMLRARPENGAKKAAQEATAALAGVPKKADDLRAAFDLLIEKGDKASEAIAKIGKDFDLSTTPGVKDAATVLDGLAVAGKISADQFNKTWTDALKGVDLKDFESRARQAFDKSNEGALRLKGVLDVALRESIQRSGLDFDVISGGMGKASTSAINDTEAMIKGLDRLKAMGVDTAQALTASIGKSINTAESQKALDVVKTQIEAVRKALGDKVADGLLDQAKQKAEQLNAALDKAKPGIDSLKEAMLLLGIVSDEALKKTAASSKEAYDYMVAKGTSSARELSEGFKKSADDAIAANKGIAPSWVTAVAAARGYEVQVDSAGKATVRMAGEGSKAVGALGEQFRMSAEQIKANEEAMDRLMMTYTLSANYTERQIALLEKENALVERRNALERERLNIDKEGYSLNTAGQRVNVAVESQASIYQRAKDSGLTEVQALELSKKTALPYNGPGLKVASPLDDGSNWSTKLQKQIDQLVLTNAAGSTSGAQTKTYRVLLENGGKSDEFNLTSDADAQRLVAAFQNARLTAS